MPEGRRTRRFVLSLLAAGALAAIIVAALWRDSARVGPPATNRPVVAQEANYVTSNSCRACHPGNYASWHASFHRTMTQVATPATLIPEAAKVELSFAGKQYRLERKG